MRRNKPSKIRRNIRFSFAKAIYTQTQLYRKTSTLKEDSDEPNDLTDLLEKIKQADIESASVCPTQQRNSLFAPQPTKNESYLSDCLGWGGNI
jgi:hypothetical protein